MTVPAEVEISENPEGTTQQRNRIERQGQVHASVFKEYSWPLQCRREINLSLVCTKRRNSLTCWAEGIVLLGWRNRVVASCQEVREGIIAIAITRCKSR